MNLDYDVYKKSIGPKDLYHLMHFCLSSVMPVQASQSVVEPEGLYQNIIGFSDFLLGSAAVIGASAFDSFSQLHCPDQIGFTTDLLWYMPSRYSPFCEHRFHRRLAVRTFPPVPLRNGCSLHSHRH